MKHSTLSLHFLLLCGWLGLIRKEQKFAKVFFSATKYGPTSKLHFTIFCLRCNWPSLRLFSPDGSCLKKTSLCSFLELWPGWALGSEAHFFRTEFLSSIFALPALRIEPGTGGRETRVLPLWSGVPNLSTMISRWESLLGSSTVDPVFPDLR